MISFLYAPPIVWFPSASPGIAYLLLPRRDGSRWRRGLCCLALLAVIGAPERHLGGARATVPAGPPTTPCTHDSARGDLVNTIGHQTMVALRRKGARPILCCTCCNRSLGRRAVQGRADHRGRLRQRRRHALRSGVERIDAVEIDPVILRHRRAAPSRPALCRPARRPPPRRRPALPASHRPQVRRVVYALVDSLILHSGYANLRLESYLFTDQAFDGREAGAQARTACSSCTTTSVRAGSSSVCRSHGRGGLRLRARRPRPALRRHLRAPDRDGFTTIIAGCNPASPQPSPPAGPSGSTAAAANERSTGSRAARDHDGAGKPLKWQRIAPTTLLDDAGRAALRD